MIAHKQASNRPTYTGYQILDWLCTLRADLDAGTLQRNHDWV
ncbi:MAG: hypothetical protein ACRDRR_03800 [Pseudonocardiaceae bacterium]